MVRVKTVLGMWKLELKRMKKIQNKACDLPFSFTSVISLHSYIINAFNYLTKILSVLTGSITFSIYFQ